LKKRVCFFAIFAFLVLTVASVPMVPVVSARALKSNQVIYGNLWPVRDPDPRLASSPPDWADPVTLVPYYGY
jgi:hypothetical protein